MDKIGFRLKSTADALASEKKWFPYNKGGERRKWYGNQDYVVNWEFDGEEIKNFTDENGKQRSVVRNPDKYFKPSISWSDITSGTTSFRYYPQGFIYDVTGMSLFTKEPCKLIGSLNTNLTFAISKIINPTIHMQIGDVSKFPFIETSDQTIDSDLEEIIAITKKDWDAKETSWNFKRNILLSSNASTLEQVLHSIRDESEKSVDRVLEIENKINKLINAENGVSAIVGDSVQREDVTLFANPDFMYPGQEEKLAIWNAELIRDFVSYAVGCMFGRYSIDKEGLILANQESSLDDYLKAVPNPRFKPDADNCIPICDDEWFTDDIVARFSEFVRIVFGEQHHSENMSFITSALNVKEKKNWTLRDYFATDFYADHVKRYRKRPIYWLFSSPKGGFKCLVYLHRFNKGTPGTVLNTYLRALIRKLQSLIEATNRTLDNAQTSAREKTVAMKNKAKYQKVLEEIQAYEKNVLYPLAQEGLEIDLDDGVRVNYLKFGPALKKITGLAAKDE